MIKNHEIEFLIKSKLIKTDKICKRCCGKCSIVFKKHWIVRCNKSICRYETSVTKNTPLYRKKISLNLMLAIYNDFIKKKTIADIAILNNVTRSCVRKTIIDISNFIFYKYIYDIEKLGGVDIIVEGDESHLVHRKYNRGRLLKDIWVLGFVERTPQKRIIMLPIIKRKKSVLNFLTLLFVKKKSKIYTDKWGGYSELKNLGYQHKTVNHSENFVDPESNCHTNTIEANWSSLKRGIPISLRRRKYINAFLLRYMLIRNNKGDELSTVLNIYF
ncbi:hypothetical protein DMUE_0281 [Dictyocoela muelleri]|nr:hypothetical protein DMUE_0281 [Dictyocoela muelleri]